MATDFLPIPGWVSWENQGAGVAVADLDGNGRPALIMFQIDNPPGANQGFYKVGKNLDADGTVTGGWSDWIAVSDWFSWENQGADIAIADLNNDGRPELIVFQIDSPPGANQGYYRIGWNLDGNGNVTGGWSDWIAVPDWFAFENQGGGIAVADLNNDGRPELVVFQVDSPEGLNQGYYRVGWNLGLDGLVTGGWSDWTAVDWFSWDNQDASIAIADLDGNGRPELVVFQIDNPPGANQGFYQIGWDLDATGKVAGGWSNWTAIPDWFSWENQGAGVAIAALAANQRPELILATIDAPPQVNQGYYRTVELPLDLDTAATDGLWRLLPDTSQILAIHAALLRTGKVLFFSGSSNNPDNANGEFGSVVWDYSQNTFQFPDTPADFFCAGHSFLPDGRLLVAGGTEDYDFGHPFLGLRDAYTFNPLTEQWEQQPQMADGRWYPTLVTLADGRVFTVSGLDKDGNLNQTAEIYQDGAGWTTLPPALNRRYPLYAHLFLLRDGRIFYSGAQYGINEGTPPSLIDLQSNTVTAVSGLSEPNHRNQAASVLLPPVQEQKVMIMGGGVLGGGAGHQHAQGATDNVDIVDLKAATPVYQAAPALHHARTHAMAVTLPDRTVLVCGGSGADESRAEATLEAEIYAPTTNTWTEVAAARVPRLYHSVAILLPDGRVMTAGSNPARKDEELRLEMYYPPYLFKGARPVISAAPATAVYGGAMEIQTPQAAEIQWVSLIKPAAPTHTLDTEQRLVELSFTQIGGDRLKVDLIDAPNLAPPGWYMLFVTDQQGVPSVARWVQLA